MNRERVLSMLGETAQSHAGDSTGLAFTEALQVATNSTYSFGTADDFTGLALDLRRRGTECLSDGFPDMQQGLELAAENVADLAPELVGS